MVEATAVEETDFDRIAHEAAARITAIHRLLGIPFKHTKNKKKRVVYLLLLPVFDIRSDVSFKASLFDVLMKALLLNKDSHSAPKLK